MRTMYREVMNNPEQMRQMLNPQNMQAMVQMQQAMQQLQGSGLVPPGGGGLAGLGGAGQSPLLAHTCLKNLNAAYLHPFAPHGDVC